MRLAISALAVGCIAASAACGVTTRSSTSTGTAVAAPVLTSASVTFMTRDDGKDEDSAIAVQILDEEGKLVAEGTVVDTEFENKTVSSPITLSITSPIDRGDVEDARVRLRLTPDGRDTWMFDLRMTLNLSDGAQRSYFWSGLRLDENAPERTLALASGRLP